MIRFILALSSLACLASAELCFDGKDIALACTAGTEFGQRLMEAIESCDYNMRSALEAGGDKTWQEVLGLTRNLTLSPRQTTCPSVEEMEEYVMRYASSQYITSPSYLVFHHLIQTDSASGRPSAGTTSGSSA